MYANKPIASHMQELARLKSMKRELDELISAEENTIKDFMKSEKVEELHTDEHRATLKEVFGTRVDSKALKVKYPQIAAEVSTPTYSQRFTFA